MIVHVHGPIPENMFEHFVTKKGKLCRRNIVARDGLPDRPWIFGVGVLRAATVSSSALAGKENCNRKSSSWWP